MRVSHYSAIYFTRKSLHLFAFSSVSTKSDINSYFFDRISPASQTSPPQTSLSTSPQTSNINLTFINLFFIYHINQTYPSHLTLTPISFPLNSSQSRLPTVSSSYRHIFPPSSAFTSITSLVGELSLSTHFTSSCHFSNSLYINPTLSLY